MSRKHNCAVDEVEMKKKPHRGRKTSTQRKWNVKTEFYCRWSKKRRNKRGNYEIIKNRYCLRKLFVSSVLCNKNKTFMLQINIWKIYVIYYQRLNNEFRVKNLLLSIFPLVPYLQQKLYVYSMIYLCAEQTKIVTLFIIFF